MRSDWLASAILRAASLLAPGDQRAEWLKEWRSELWYIAPPASAAFCLGAFRDALWLRRNSPGEDKPAAIHLQSPLACLAFLAALGAASLLLASHLSAWRDVTQPTRALIPAGYVLTLFFSLALLPLTRLALGQTNAGRHSMPWPSGLRRGIFLAWKIVLVQPIMLAGFILLAQIERAAPMAGLGLFAFWIAALRWVLVDQRRRCPVCLRLLTDPIRIGSPSQTFLEWYGGESMCARGHGMLHNPEIPNSCYDRQEWHKLDGSWSALFRETAALEAPRR